jgi:hypothetical protein
VEHHRFGTDQGARSRSAGRGSDLSSAREATQRETTLTWSSPPEAGRRSWASMQQKFG